MNRDKLYFYKKICASDLPSGAISVYKELLQYANYKTWSCFPSVRTISQNTHLSDRTVRRHLKLLEKEGYIIKCPRQRKDHGYTSNMYFFN